MTDTTDEPQTAGGGSPEISPRTERLSDQTSEPQAPPAAPPKTPIGIGGPPKPPGGGRTLAMRIGILVVGLAAGLAAVRATLHAPLIQALRGE